MKEEREEIGIETEEEDTEIWMGKIMEEILPAITLDQMKDETANDAKLVPILKEKQEGTKSKETSKGPYGKLWDEITERWC